VPGAFYHFIAGGIEHKMIFTDGGQRQSLKAGEKDEK